MKIKDIKLENSLWSAQLTIVSDDRQELERIFENAGKVDPEKEYTVKIEPRRKKRSLDANAYMWQLLNKLAEKVQNSPVVFIRFWKLHPRFAFSRLVARDLTVFASSPRHLFRPQS